MTTTSLKLGFIGLGIMGTPMAGHLIAAGHQVHVWARRQVPQAIVLRQRLVALGNRGVPLRTRRREQRLQRVDVARKLIGHLAHARH